jgi:RHS repeat-associated protein
MVRTGYRRSLSLATRAGGVTLVSLVALLALPSQTTAQEVIEYYGHDAIGSIRVVFDATGAVVARHDFTPFGEQIGDSSPIPKERYAGLFRDGEAGLDYAQARMYQSRTGRFNAPDPVYAGLFAPQGWNRYSYALNSPVGMTDPTGMQVANQCNTGGQHPDTGVFYYYNCESSGSYTGFGYNLNNTVSTVSFLLDLLWRIQNNLPRSGSDSGRGSTSTAQGTTNTPSAPTTPNTPTAPVPPPVDPDPPKPNDPCQASGWLRLLPDYTTYSFNVSIPTPVTTWFGATGTVAIDRFGHLFAGLGPNVGKSVTVVSGNASVAWMGSHPGTVTAADMKAFLGGTSVNISAGFMSGAGVTKNSSGWGAEVGGYWPQIGASVTRSGYIGNIVGSFAPCKQ